MTKVFFFPAFFALRGLGTRMRLTAAALGVFLATWLLHAYQVFWITGGFPLTLSDAGLWLIVGVLVAVNLQRDLTRAARPAPPARDDNPKRNSAWPFESSACLCWSASFGRVGIRHSSLASNT